jgi:hypothetical protein
LQPLTVVQIEDYFAQFELRDVWQTVQQDEGLQELLTKPLFLSMFGLVQTQGKFFLSDWQSRTTSESKIEYLFDTYWEATMSRELIIDPNDKRRGIRSKTYSTKPPPHRKAVRRALVFAAKMLERESSTELLIEKLQPTALINRRQKWAYRLSGGLILWLIYGLIYGLIFELIFGLSGGLILWLILGLIYGLIEPDSIKPVEEISVSMSREGRGEILCSTLKYLIFLLIGRLIVGLIVGLIGWSLIVGLIVRLNLGLIDGLKADIQTRIKPNQGIKNSVKNMVIVSAITLMMALPFKFLLEYLLASVVEPDVPPGIVTASLFILIWSSFDEAGGDALRKHLALRLVLAWNRYAPLRYDLLLNYCTERLLLQRVGGRYRFMHKLLQDHFAKMDLG